jgi:hypothetical protein
LIRLRDIGARHLEQDTSQGWCPADDVAVARRRISNRAGVEARRSSRMTLAKSSPGNNENMRRAMIVSRNPIRGADADLSHADAAAAE